MWVKRCARVSVAVSQVLSVHISEMNFDHRPPSSHIPVFYRWIFQPPIRWWSSWSKFLPRYIMSVQAAIDGVVVRKSIPRAFTVHVLVTKYTCFVSMGALSCAMLCRDVWVAPCLIQRDLGRALFGASTVSHAVFGLVSLPCGLFSVKTFGLRSTESRWTMQSCI